MLARESAQIVRSLMSEALLDAEFAVVMREILIASRRRALREILMRGIARREIPSDVDIELAMDLAYGPVWYRLLNNHAPLDKAFARQLSKMICAFLKRPA
jgi:hypothetical protein